MIAEALLLQPSLGDLSVSLCARSEKTNFVPFIVPTIALLAGIRIYLGCGHALRLFVGDVFTNGSIDIDEKVFDVGRKHR
jgi:hypothetical protein